MTFAKVTSDIYLAPLIFISLHLMRLKLAFVLAVEQCLQSFRIKMVKIRKIWKNYLPKRLLYPS